jgi:glycosyltransferase involved in cell wall biosynthesis
VSARGPGQQAKCGTQQHMAPDRRAGPSLPRTIVSLEVATPSLETERDGEHLLKELSRDFPWALEDGWCVEYWGLRGPGRRSLFDGRLRTSGLRFPWLGAPLRVRVLCAWIVHFLLALRRPRTGILFAASPWSGLGAAAARTLRGRRARLAVRIQGSTSSRSLLMRGSKLESRLIRAIERFVLARADLVVPMGSFTKGIAEDAGVPPERIVELVFPTSWGRASPVDRDDERVDRGRVVCAGRLESEKGIDVLLRAWPEVVSTRPNARLEIAGDGPQRPELERLAQRLGVKSHVRFRGWVPAEDMPAFFGRALVAVLPSRWEEGLGMVLVEAGLAGCDLVGSDLGGIRDMVEHGKTGLLVPPDDPGALAEALRDSIARPEAALQRGAAAREKALEYLSRRERGLSEFRERLSSLRKGPIPPPNHELSTST